MDFECVVEGTLVRNGNVVAVGVRPPDLFDSFVHSPQLEFSLIVFLHKVSNDKILFSKHQVQLNHFLLHVINTAELCC